MLIATKSWLMIMQIIVGRGRIVLWGAGCQHPCSENPRASEYTSAGQKLMARCIRWSSIRLSFWTLWLPDLKPC